MIELPAKTRIWIAAGVTDMRRGFQGLSAQIQTTLEQQPYSGHLFVFRGRGPSFIMHPPSEARQFKSLVLVILKHFERRREYDRGSKTEHQSPLESNNDRVANRDAELRGMFERSLSIGPVTRQVYQSRANSALAHDAGRLASACATFAQVSSNSAPVTSSRGGRTRALPVPVSCCTCFMS